MATSGTYTFNVQRDDIIKASLRILGVIGAGDTPTSDETTNASQALNIMIKAWQTSGMKLWTVQELSFATVVGKANYSLGPSGDTFTSYRPLRVIDAHLRDSNNHDVSLMVVSRQEYDLLGDKTTQGVPNQVFYDPQLTNGVLYVYNVPTDTAHSIILTVQRPLQDMTAATNDFDFAQEWFQALKWGLASELGLEYGVNPAVQAQIDNKALYYKEQMDSWSQEEASTFFTPNSQMYR